MKTLEPIFSNQSRAIYLTLSQNTTDRDFNILSDEISLTLRNPLGLSKSKRKVLVASTKSRPK